MRVVYACLDLKIRKSVAKGVISIQFSDNDAKWNCSYGQVLSAMSFFSDSAFKMGIAQLSELYT